MSPESVTAVVEAAAAVIAIARLVSLRLAGTFPALVSFLTVIAATAALGSSVPAASRFYFWLYTAETPIYCLFALLSARELFALVFRRYPGIRTAGRMAMYGCAALASAVAIAIAVAHSGTKFFLTHLGYIELARRSIVLSVALFILFILFTLSRYPLELGRNTRISGAMFSILFLSQAAQLLLDSFSPHLYSRSVDIMNVVFGSVCILFWAAMLREEQPAAPRPTIVKFSADQERKLLDELENINRLLTRAARR